MKAIHVLAGVLCLGALACNEVTDKTKDVLHEGGEKIGKGASQLVDGIKEGVEEFHECKIELSDEVKADGMKVGKFEFSDGEEGEDNLLSIYVIFEKDFVHSLRARLLDENGEEYGRTTTEIGGKVEDAGFVEFQFDPRSSIQSKSTIILEYP